MDTEIKGKIEEALKELENTLVLNRGNGLTTEQEDMANEGIKTTIKIFRCILYKKLEG